MRENAVLSKEKVVQYSYVEQKLFALLKESDSDFRYKNAEALWQEVYTKQLQPVAIDNRALFLFHGKAQHVSIVGDWSYWQPAQSLKRIENTDLFYAIVQFPEDARLQYKLIVDGAWMNDPANPKIIPEGFGYNSEFIMPKYVDISNLQHTGVAVKASIERVLFESTQLNSNREVFLYTHPFAVNKSNIPLLVVHDGAEAINLGKFSVVFDNLIGTKQVVPFAAIFVSPQMRNDEYATSDKYISFTAEEIFPFALNEFNKRGIHISNETEMHCVTGASLGGLLSTKTVLKYPEVFGSVIAQSPSYWWNKGEIFRSQEMANAHKLNFIIQTGTICDAKDLASLMVTRLKMLGARVAYFEHSQGHTWGNWRTTIAQAMLSWLSKRSEEITVH